MTRKNTIVTFAALALVAASGLLSAGPLNPPAGPVTSTNKTLLEVEPRIAISATNTPGDATSLYMITQPGSYYLTGNITGEAGKNGIGIAVGGVTLDLRGFELVGVPGEVSGVTVTAGGVSNITVVNGTIRDWGRSGVELYATNCRVCDLQVSGNTGQTGITVSAASTISKCAAAGNAYGFFAGPGCAVLDCSASSNAGVGILVQEGTTVSNCSVYSNGGTGIATYRGCTLSNCAAFSNTGDGFGADDGSTLSNCVAFSNAGNGIRVAYGCVLSKCSAHQNTGVGIYAFGEGCTLSSCSGFSNIGIGISLGAGGVAADGSAAWNSGDGIVCSTRCVVRGNTCSNNGNFGGDGAGIHATGNKNRIEGNDCTGADRGIDVDAAGNIIVRNTCSGNTNNWDVVAGNVILVINATTAPAVSGNSGGVNPGSDNPYANFTY